MVQSKILLLGKEFRLMIKYLHPVMYSVFCGDFPACPQIAVLPVPSHPHVSAFVVVVVAIMEKTKQNNIVTTRNSSPV